MSDKKTLGLSLGVAAAGLIAIAGLVVAIIAKNKADDATSSTSTTNSDTNPTFTTMVSGAVSTEVLNIVKPSARNGVAESTTVYTLPTAAGTAGQVITLGADAKKAVWATATGGGGSGSVSGPATSTNNGLATFSDATGTVLASSTVTMDGTDGLAGVASITGKSNAMSIGKASNKTAVDHFTSKERFEWVVIVGDAAYQATLEPYQKMVPTLATSVTMHVPTAADLGTIVTLYNAGASSFTLTIAAADLVAPIVANAVISPGYSQDFVAVFAGQKGWSPVLEVTTGKGDVLAPPTGTLNTVATYTSATQLKDTTVTIVGDAMADVLSITGKATFDPVTVASAGAGAAETTGALTLQSGAAVGAGTTGNVTVESGSAAAGTTGSVALGSGLDSTVGGTSGDVAISSGTVDTGTSGKIEMKTGLNATATGVTGRILLETGGDAEAGTTGKIEMKTGTVVAAGIVGDVSITTGAHVAGTGGIITLSTGGAGAVGTSGAVNINSGGAAAGTTGGITIASGTDSGIAVKVGDVSLKTGGHSAGVAGILTLETGTSATGTSGAVNITSGAGAIGATGIVTVASGGDSGAGTIGDLVLKSGNHVAGTAGNVMMSSGTAGAGGTSGNVNIWSGSGATLSGDISLWTDTTGTGTGILNLGTSAHPTPVLHDQASDRWTSTAETNTSTLTAFTPLVVVTVTGGATAFITLPTPTAGDLGKIITLCCVGAVAGDTLTVVAANIAGAGSVDTVVLSGQGLRCIAVLANAKGWCVL
jgi:hypothetical protein